MTTLTATKPEITSPVIFKTTIKATGETVYLVPSDSVHGECYQVRWNEQAQEWQCPCRDRKPCKHMRAVNQVRAEQYKAMKRREEAEEQAYNEYCEKVLFPVLDEIDQERKIAEQAQAADRRQHGALNGNRGFSLMR